MKLKPLITVFAVFLTTLTDVNAQCSGFGVQILRSTDTVCIGDPFTFQAAMTNSSSTINWILPDNSVINNSYSIGASSATLSMQGWYTCIAQYGSCSDTDKYYLRIGAHPQQPYLTNNGPICEGDTLIITINTITSYSWLHYSLADMNGVLSSTAVTKFPNATLANNAKTYYGTVYDSVGCPSFYNSTYINQGVLLNKPAKPKATSNSPVCNGGDILLLGPVVNNPYYSYLWTEQGNSNTYSSIYVNITNPVTPGTYQYYLQIKYFNCLSEADTVYVDVGQPTTPKVSITASPSTTVGPYTPITLTAKCTDTGSIVQYQWYKNLLPIPGATNKTLHVTAMTDVINNDAITVQITTKPLCAIDTTASSSAATININLDVNNVQADHFSLYPNPVKDVLTITGIDPNEGISITSVTGRRYNLPVSQDNKKVQISTQQLPAGVYLLRCGEQMTNFVKED